jgi:hypothetical protein
VVQIENKLDEPRIEFCGQSLKVFIQPGMAGARSFG